jgi:ribosomal protein S12 methylthiotransferase accessory factor
MATVREVMPLVDEETGIILRIGLARKPLWFSDIKMASTLTNQWPGAVTTIAQERRRPTKDFKESKEPFWSPASVSVGVGYDQESAIMRAIGEGIERFCGQIVSSKSHAIHRASYRELSRKYEMPDLALFQALSKEQLAEYATLDCVKTAGSMSPVFELKPDAEIRWVEVGELTEDARSVIPLSAAFLGIRVESKDERIIEQISTGMACHISLDAAIVSGISEIIERDAFVGMWLRRLSPPRVSPDSFKDATPLVSTIVRELSRTRYKLTVNDLTTDLEVPTFLATVTANEAPYTVVGASSHPDAHVALEKALLEVMMALCGFAQRYYMRESFFDLYQELKPGEILPADQVRRMQDHSEMYAHNDLRDRLDFYLSALEVPFRGQTFNPDSGTSSSQKEKLLSIFRSKGYRVYVNDLTINEVRKYGMYVIKAFIPGLLPLYCAERNKPLGYQRLREYHEIFPQRVNFEEPINLWVHPFP